MRVHNPDKLPTMPIADILPSQGELKDLSDKNYAKLKNNIEKRGFLMPVYTWIDSKDKLRYLLDGHQRQRVLTTEGWNEPIPYLTITQVGLEQKTTQTNSGGMTEMYKSEGTYVKSFYSVMASPSSVKINLMGNKNKRMHHVISWGHTVPKIIKESYKK